MKEENIFLPVAAGIGLLLLFSRGNDEPFKNVPAPGAHLMPLDFIKTYWDQAKQSERATTIPALFTITQGGLESNWGNNAPRNNFFGIKSSPAWHGDIQVLPTKEYVNGHLINTTAVFRAYPSAKDGFIDHGKFFIVNPRYAQALRYTSDPMKFADMIARAGYATDPNYASKLQTSMRLVMQLLSNYGLI